MKLVPLQDRVIVEPEKREEKSPGGIYIPPTAKETPQIGTVLAVGIGEYDIKGGEYTPMDLKEGDMVFYPKFAGSEIEVDRRVLLIIKESEILAKVE